jgi:hypothetical protein
MTTSASTALLAALLLSANAINAQQVQAPDYDKDDERACQSVRLEPYPPVYKKDKDAKGPNPAYSARAILDLRLEIKLGPKHTPELLDLRYYGPNGHLYESRVLAIGAGASPIAAEQRAESADPETNPHIAETRTVAGYPLPLDVQIPHEQIENAVPERSVRATLPVGGTLISVNSLYGQWRVDIHADGAVTPCATAQFVIKP